MPNRSESLVWESSDDPAARGELVTAALTIADAEGLAAVSVRRVAKSVGRRPMSLYSYVPSRDALVALMFERISAQMLVPEPLPDDGRDLLGRIATRSFETYLAHPWMLHAFGLRPPPGPTQLHRAEQSAHAVALLGFASEDAWTAVSILHEWTMGHALHTITLREDAALKAALERTDAERHPEAAIALSAAPTRDGGEAFAGALQVVLAGLDASFARD